MSSVDPTHIQTQVCRFKTFNGQFRKISTPCVLVLVQAYTIVLMQGVSRYVKDFNSSEIQVGKLSLKKHIPRYVYLSK